MASAFPKLPGFVPTQDLERSNWKRVSAAKQEQNRDSKNEPIIVYPLPRQTKPEAPNQSGALNPNYMSTTHSTFKPTFTGEMTELFQPSWVKLDRQVLRFYGFFKESVVESPLENYRVRKIDILFYLEDNSVCINEPKQTNSGIPQGPFLKRQKILRGDGSGKHVTVQDFRVGQEIHLFGKNVFIVGCDQYTREFYDNINMPQNDDLAPPTDNFEQKTLYKFVPQKDHMMKDFLEHKLGGGRVTSQKQFLENDRKVLRFFCESEHPYIIHYYLADDTIEIREVNFANSGRDPFPLLLKRQKLPRQLSLGQPGQTVAQDFIKLEEIRFNEEFVVFGRKFFIKGCDPFTQRYLRDAKGIDFPLGSSETLKQFESVPLQIPPYNGFGDEEDSLGYVYRLVPIPPKKDYFKWMDNQQYLRFKGKFITNKPEDINREFIITFFLHDDTVLVYEPVQRNSGFVSGKFLEKGKYKNTENGNQFFNPADFRIGKDVKINGYSFRISKCDEFTKKWYEENFREVIPQEFVTMFGDFPKINNTKPY